jgi:VCBS repeat-containing protein
MKRFAAVLTTFVFVFFLAGCDASSPVGTSNDASTSQPGDGSSTTSKSIPDDFAYETTRDVKVVLRAAQGGVAAQVLAPTYDRGDILLVDGETNENGVLRTTLPLPTAMSEVLVRTSERTVTVPVNNGRVEFNLSSKSAKRAKASRAPDKTVQGNPSCSAYADHFSGVSQDLVQAKRIEGSELSTLIGNTPHDFNTSHGTITVESVTTKNGGNEIVDMTISTDFEVRGVTAKGGPKANLWVLDPAQLLNSREYTPPTNPGGQQAGMSHLDICINPDDGDDDDDDDGDDDDGDDDDEDCDEDDGDDGDDDDDESCAPDASNDAFSTDEDQTLNVSAPGVLQNDTDPNSDNLSVTLVSGPSNGSLTLNSDGSFDYTPNANFNGQDSFTYEASDGNGGTDQATVTITVHSVNDPVSASDDAYSTDQGQTLSVNAPGVLQNDSDPDGDNLTVSQVLSNPSNGTVTLNSDGSFDYTPNGGFSGQDSFTYEVSDGNGSTAPATVTITVNNVNDAPTAQNDTYTTDEDQPLTVNAPGILQNDSDPDSDTLTATLESGPSNGSLTLNGDGSFNYTPDTNFNGQDTFTYKAADGNGGMDQAVVTITVNPVNDTPTANDDTYSTPEGQTLQVGAPNGTLSNDTDPDQGDNLSASLVSGPSNGSLTFGPDGSIIYTPDTGFSGQPTPASAARTRLPTRRATATAAPIRPP